MPTSSDRFSRNAQAPAPTGPGPRATFAPTACMRRLNRLLVLGGLAAVLVLKPVEIAYPAQAVKPRLSVVTLGPVAIEPGNHFSENTRLRIALTYPADHPRAFQPLDHPVAITIEEWVTEVYDGRNGATRLPMTILVHAGRAEVTLKSVASYTHRDRRNAPVPSVRISTAFDSVQVGLPQWVDMDGDGMTDWLQRRVENILWQARRKGSADVVAVLASLRGWQESYKMDCGGVEAESPDVMRISTVCLDDNLVNRHRLNLEQELTATVLHEAWHVWDIRRRQLAGALHTYPASGYGRCVPDRHPQMAPLYRLSCPRGYVYDALYRKNEEADAEAFATRFRHLFR
jgi:hypothetical protein